jgi:hypothetical protein
MQRRQLAAAYKFNEKTFVWKCDLCAKMFFLGVEEARFYGIAKQTLNEFESHACQLPTANSIQGPEDELGRLILTRRKPNLKDEETGRE